MQRSERSREARSAKRPSSSSKEAVAIAPKSAERSRAAVRDERIEFRVRPETKDLLVRASELTGGNLTAFVLESAQQRAVEVIERYERLRLNNNDRDRMLEAFEAPPAPNAALRRAFKNHA